MIIDLSRSYNLRAAVLEYAGRILLRKQERNNFIFHTRRFTNLDEVIKKYRLNSENIEECVIKEINSNWNKCDIIQIVLNNKEERIIKTFIFYDVKTKFHLVERNYFETCESNHAFMQKIYGLGFDTQIISIVLFENWRFSFNLYEYSKQKIVTYSRYEQEKIK